MDDGTKQGKPRGAGRPLLAVGVGVLSGIAMGLFTTAFVLVVVEGGAVLR